MANHVSHAALPYPVKGARYTIQVPYLDADGDPTDPTTPDTEVSKDGAAFADCAEEVTTITGSNGVGYLTFSGAETDCSMMAVAAKVASGPKATLGTFYPRVLPVVYSGTASAGAAGSITLAGCPAIADLLIGSIVKTTGGTGGGGTGGANNQARVITGYTAAGVASVSPNWETNPSSDTTFEVLLTEGSLLRSIGGFADSGTAQAGASSTITLASTASGTDDIYNYQRVDIIAGTGAGQSAIITDYVGSTKVATVDHAWQTTPDSSSKYRVWFSRVPRDVSKVTGDVEGKILGGGAGTITDAGVWAYDHVGAAITSLDAAGVRTALGLASANLDTQLSGIAGYIDTEMAAVKAVTDKIDTTLVLDGSVYQFTANALELGPSGSGLDAAGVRAAVGLGSANLDTQLSGIAGYIDTEVSAIKAKTDNLPADTAASLAAIAGYIDTEMAAVKAVTDKIDTALVLDGSVYQFTANALELAPSAGAMTCTELTGVPGASPSLAEAVAFVYMELRNRFDVDGSKRTIRNDAGTVIAEQTISDSAGVFTRSKFANPV